MVTLFYSNDLGISKQAFLMYAIDDAEFAECFGLFPFLYKRLLAPIEEMVCEKFQEISLNFHQKLPFNLKFD